MSTAQQIFGFLGFFAARTFSIWVPMALAAVLSWQVLRSVRSGVAGVAFQHRRLNNRRFLGDIWTWWFCMVLVVGGNVLQSSGGHLVQAAGTLLSFFGVLAFAAVLSLQVLSSLRSGVANAAGVAFQRRSNPRGFWCATGARFFVALTFGGNGLYWLGGPFVQAARTLLELGGA